MSIYSALTTATGIVKTVEGAYNDITRTTSLPDAVNSALGAAYSIFNEIKQTDTNTAHAQTNNVNANMGSFKWAEMETIPDSFATSDAAIIFAGDPYYMNNMLTSQLVPIGMCQGFSYASSVNVVPIHELRCEEIVVLPGKTQPGQITMTRFCGDYASLVNRVHGVTGPKSEDLTSAVLYGVNVDANAGWNFSGQSSTFRSLFGLLVVFYNERRNGQFASLYFERCAITGVSFNLQAGNYQVLDAINIVCGRCINPDDKETYYATEKDSADMAAVRATREINSNIPEPIPYAPNTTTQPQQEDTKKDSTKTPEPNTNKDSSTNTNIPDPGTNISDFTHAPKAVAPSSITRDFGHYDSSKINTSSMTWSTENTAPKDVQKTDWSSMALPNLQTKMDEDIKNSAISSFNL